MAGRTRLSSAFARENASSPQDTSPRDCPCAGGGRDGVRRPAVGHAGRISTGPISGARGGYSLATALSSPLCRARGSSRLAPDRAVEPLENPLGGDLLSHEALDDLARDPDAALLVPSPYEKPPVGPLRGDFDRSAVDVDDARLPGSLRSAALEDLARGPVFGRPSPPGSRPMLETAPVARCAPPVRRDRKVTLRVVSPSRSRTSTRYAWTLLDSGAGLRQNARIIAPNSTTTRPMTTARIFLNLSFPSQRSRKRKVRPAPGACRCL